MAEIRRSPVEVGRLSHYLRGLYILGGAGFQPSTVWHLFLPLEKNRLKMTDVFILLFCTTAQALEGKKPWGISGFEKKMEILEGTIWKPPVIRFEQWPKYGYFSVCRGLYYPVIFHDYFINHETRIPSLTNQDSMESIRVFFSWLIWVPIWIVFIQKFPAKSWRQIFSTFHGPKNRWEFQSLF